MMCQIGHVPLAALPRQHAVAHAVQLRGLEDRGDPALAGVVRPTPATCSATLIGQLIALGGKLFRGLAEEHRRRGGAHHPGAVRLVERLQQRQPIVGGLRLEHVGVAGVDRRNPGVGQRPVAGRARPCAVSTITAMSRARSGWPSKVAPLASSAPMSAARSAPMCCAQLVDREVLCPAAAERGSSHHAQPERVVARRTGQPMTLVLSLDVVHDDRGVAEFGAAQHRLQPLDERPSLRQFVPSVSLVAAVSAARR